VKDSIKKWKYGTYLILLVLSCSHPSCSHSLHVISRLIIIVITVIVAVIVAVIIATATVAAVVVALIAVLLINEYTVYKYQLELNLPLVASSSESW
jgi:hypothetical protein